MIQMSQELFGHMLVLRVYEVNIDFSWNSKPVGGIKQAVTLGMLIFVDTCIYHGMQALLSRVNPRQSMKAHVDKEI